MRFGRVPPAVPSIVVETVERFHTFVGLAEAGKAAVERNPRCAVLARFGAFRFPKASGWRDSDDRVW